MKFKIKYQLSFFFLLTGLTFYAQFQNEQERKEYANELFKQKKFIEAEPHMLHFLSLENTTDYSFKYGVCALHKYADKSKAIRFLKFAIKDREVDSRAFFYLGKAYHLNYLFNDAIKNFELFKSKTSAKFQREFLVDMHVAMCESGKTLMKTVTDLVVEDKIESTIDRFNYSYDFSKIGGRILVTDEFQSKYDKKVGYRSVIYFPPPPNNVVFFSSYGKDGANGLDLYKVEQRIDKSWSEPELLPPHINTPYDDAFPFLHADGKTFYFSSKGHSSMGGYDIFRSYYEPVTSSYGPPSNMDYKINTPADDIMYVVDSINKNAFFSSSRAAKGDFLDVYKVRVEVFPIQNVIIAGEFFNEIDPSDSNAEIKIIDLVSDQVIGIYHPNKENKYTIILPKSGKYKFFVETPNSESIHEGLVEVMPQKELSLLKQEIALVKPNGVEQLIIRNLFDQKVENESEILAQVMRELSNPEINLDEFNDSLFIEDLAVEETLIEQPVEEITQEVDLVALSDELAQDSRSEADQIATKMNASFQVAQNKSKESEQAAKQAQEILKNIDEIENPLERQQQADLANEYHQKSKSLNQQAIAALNVGNALKDQFEIKDKEAKESKEIAASIKAAIEEDSHEVAMSHLAELQENLTEIIENDTYVDVSSDNVELEAKAIQKKANKHLENAQQIRNDQEAVQVKLDNAKKQLESTKKNKAKQEIELKIKQLDQELALNKQLADDEFAKYEKLANKSEGLADQAVVLAELDNIVVNNPTVAISDQQKKEIENDIDANNVLIAEIPIQEIEEIASSVAEVDELEQNDQPDSKDQTEPVVEQDFLNEEPETSELSSSDQTANTNSNINNANESNPVNVNNSSDLAVDNTENDTPDSNNSLKEEKENDLSSESIAAEQQEIAYQQVASDLENSESSNYDYSDSFNESISYNTEASSLAVQAIDNDLEMLIVAKQELAALQYANQNEQKATKKAAQEQEINEKVVAISKMEQSISADFEAVIANEKSNNDSIFSSVEDLLTDELLKDPDFLSAKYYNDQALKQYENAQQLKKEALTISDITEKAALLREAHQYELAAVENQQDALNLLDEVEIPQFENALADNKQTQVSNDLSSAAANQEESEVEVIEQEVATETVAQVDETSASENTNPIANQEESEVEVTEQKVATETVAQVDETSASENANPIANQEESEVEVTEQKVATETVAQVDKTSASEKANPIANQEEPEVEVTEQAQPTDQEKESLQNSDESLSENIATVSDDNSVVEPTLITQNVAGEQFNSNKEPEVYQVASIIGDQIAHKEINYSSSTSTDLMTLSNQQVLEIDEVQAQIDQLNNQKNTANNQKKEQKIQQKIDDLQEKKLKKEIQLAEVYQLANEQEIAISKSNLELVKSESRALVSNSYEFKQGEQYEKAADELLFQAEAIRNEAALENDLVERNKLLVKATNSELAATQKLATAKKLFAEALVEDVSVSETLNPTKVSTTLSSDELNDKVDNLNEMASVNFEKASAIKLKAVNTKNEERSALLFEAEQLESLAREQSSVAIQINSKAERVKAYEEAIVEQQVLAENLKTANVDEIVTSNEYQSYYNQQLEINELATQLNAVEQEAIAYDKLFKQQTIAANAYFNKAINEKDPQKKNQYIAKAKALKENAMLNKTSADEIAQEVDLLAKEVRKKKVAQAEVISSLDENTSNSIIAISRASDFASETTIAEVVEQNLANEANDQFDEKTVSESFPQSGEDQKVSTIEDLEPEQANESLDLVDERIDSQTLSTRVNKEAPTVELVAVTLSSFKAPEKIESDIFIVNSETSYSESNPIPVNPPHPDGLIFKVQVGAFRRPIPQDLFKGFAPISAEKVRDDITRYRVGYFKNEQNANTSKNTIRGLGYSDAFVVAIYNGDRIPVSEARALIANNPAIAQAATSAPSITTPTQDSQSAGVNSNQDEEVDQPLTSNSDVQSTPITTEVQKLNSPSYVEDLSDDVAEVNPVENIKGLFYSVQIGAFSKPLDKDNAFNISPLVIQNVNRLYKYSTGIFNSVQEAKVRKDEMNQLGLADAFIVAFFDGSRITIAKSLELAANNSPTIKKQNSEDNGVTVLPANEGKEYYVNLGVFNDSVPKAVSNALLSMKEFRIKPRSLGDFRQYLSGVFTTLEKAKDAQQKFTDLGIQDAEVVEYEDGKMLKGNPKAIEGLVYRVHLGTYYEKVPRKLRDVFMRLDYLDVEKISSTDQEDYYASKKQFHYQAQQVLSDCLESGVVVAKIMAFIDGKEIEVDLAKQLTRE